MSSRFRDALAEQFPAPTTVQAVAHTEEGHIDISVSGDRHQVTIGSTEVCAVVTKKKFERSYSDLSKVRHSPSLSDEIRQNFNLMKLQRCFEPLGPMTGLQTLLGAVTVIVAVAWIDDSDKLSQSHFTHLRSGNATHFDGAQFHWTNNLGQLFLSWCVGMLTMAWMMPLYVIWHRLSPKFRVYMPLARNWRLHVFSGACCAIFSFVGFFVSRPQPLMRIAAISDILHFATTMYQMRIMMFGDRDIIYPEYLWLMLLKLGLAIQLFCKPCSPMAALHYGVTLSAFSYQRLFIFFFRGIYKNQHYVLATTFCGALGGWQAMGCFWSVITLFIVMAFYMFVLKGSWFAGDDVKGAHDKDRELNLFQQKSMERVKMDVLKSHAGLLKRISLLPRADSQIFKESQKTTKVARLQLAMAVTKAMSAHRHLTEQQEVGHVDGLVNLLFRFGFTSNHVEKMLESFGLDIGGPAGTFDISDVESNKKLRTFLKLLCDEFTEQAIEEGQVDDIVNSLVSHSLEEICRHSSVDSLWLLIEGRVYDVTEFAPRHPGGADKLMELGGSDATEQWTKKHGGSAKVREVMSHLCIGRAKVAAITGQDSHNSTQVVHGERSMEVGPMCNIVAI